MHSFGIRCPNDININTEPVEAGVGPLLRSSDYPPFRLFCALD